MNIYQTHNQIFNHFQLNKAQAQRTMSSKDPKVLEKWLRNLQYNGKNGAFIALIYQKMAETVVAADTGMDAFAHKMKEIIRI